MPTAAPLLLLAVHTVRLSALVCRLAHLHPLLHPLLQRMALCVICCQCTDCDSVFRTCAVCQEMPRYRGVGMPKAKKKTVEPEARMAQDDATQDRTAGRSAGTRRNTSRHDTAVS